jgi:hypothetical protein
MNLYQRLVLLLGTTLLLFVLLYPPYVCRFVGSGPYPPAHRQAGHHWIFSPPTTTNPEPLNTIFSDLKFGPYFFEFRINRETLAIYALTIVVVTVGLLFALKPTVAPSLSGTRIGADEV